MSIAKWLNAGSVLLVVGATGSGARLLAREQNAGAEFQPKGNVKTDQNTLKELRANVEKNRTEERAKRVKWQIEKSKVTKLLDQIASCWDTQLTERACHRAETTSLSTSTGLRRYLFSSGRFQPAAIGLHDDLSHPQRPSHGYNVRFLSVATRPIATQCRHRRRLDNTSLSIGKPHA